MHNWYKKLNNFLVALLLIAQVFITPLHAFAQDEESSVSTESIVNVEVNNEVSSDALESTRKEETSEQSSDTASEVEEVHHSEATALSSMAYTTATVFEINGNPVLNNAQYGEGKFYITPTFIFPDDAVLNNGDVISYPIPEVFKVDGDQVIDIAAVDGTTIGRLETMAGSKVAKVTITNAEYFVRLNEDKKITPSFTVVWDHANVPLDTPVTFNLEGYPTQLTLTRILVDNELSAHSKWGSQNSQDLSIINWKIRVNRDVKAIGNVTLHDVIPDNQELVGNVTGLYFDSWNANEQHGNYLPEGEREFDSNLVQVNGNEFTINLGDMSTKGVLLSYQTRITGPIDKVNKKVYNKLSITSNEGTFTRDDWFAPLRVVDGIARGSRSDVVTFEVKKELTGRPLKAGEFEFELVNSENDQVLDTVKNTADGTVKFTPQRFATVGEYEYKIREKASNLPGVTNDANLEITANVTVSDDDGVKTATVKYNRNKFTNQYVAEPVTVNLPMIKKFLSGKAIEADKYAFELKEAGTVKETVKNKADGTAIFAPLTFNQTGTYTYTINEVLGTEAGMKYDTSIYTLTVNVTDNEVGQLIATIEVAKAGTSIKDIIFTNIYTPQEVPKESKESEESKESKESKESEVPKTSEAPKESQKETQKQLPKTGENHSAVLLTVAVLALVGSAIVFTAKKER